MAASGQRAGKAPMLWYYTTVKTLHEILGRGELQPERIGRSAKEKPAVWFSSNQEWEPAANMPWEDPDGMAVRLGKDQTYVLGGGLARIGVAPEVAPHDWKTFKQQSGIAPKIRSEEHTSE